jgi:zinc-finger binding domain of transposase IS66
VRGGELHCIGEDKSERLDIVPAQFKVVVTRRPKYGCRTCEGTVVQAPAPDHVVAGGIPSEALVAHVIRGFPGFVTAGDLVEVLTRVRRRDVPRTALQAETHRPTGVMTAALRQDISLPELPCWSEARSQWDENDVAARSPHGSGERPISDDHDEQDQGFRRSSSGIESSRSQE